MLCCARAFIDTGKIMTKLHLYRYILMIQKHSAALLTYYFVLSS